MKHVDPREGREELRDTGIPPIRLLPWGSHICMFYETPGDLVDVNAAYFAAGLRNNEYCVWTSFHPFDRDLKRAEDALRQAMPDFDDYLAQGAIEIIPGYAWYLIGGEFDPQRIAGGWHAKLEEALHRGFEGMRVSGNAFWMEKNLWESFPEYEAELGRIAAHRPMLILCTYLLQAARAADVLDVAATHHFTLARRNGRWDFLEEAELRGARR